MDPTIPSSPTPDDPFVIDTTTANPPDAAPAAPTVPAGLSTEDLLAHPVVQAAIAQAAQDHATAIATPAPVVLHQGQLVEFATVDLYGAHGPEEVVLTALVIDLLPGDPNAAEGSLEREDRATVAWLDVSGPMFTSALRPRP